MNRRKKKKRRKGNSKKRMLQRTDMLAKEFATLTFSVPTRKQAGIKESL